MKINVQDDPRYTKRKMFGAVGNNIFKILTEIITNSDDSYKRMMFDEKGDDDRHAPKPIRIIVNRNKKLVEIVDNAQGMSFDVMKEKFEYYGGDKSEREKGYKSRGLFGKGASDVLFTQDKAHIISIKENLGSKCKFAWEDNHRSLDLKELNKREVKMLRERYEIPANGTIVSFKLNDETKIPKLFKEKLQAFYMLRHIFSDSIERLIELEEIGSKGVKTKTILSYEFPTYNETELLINEIIKFKYDDKEVKASLKLVRLDDKKKYEDKYGELNILVYDDEKNIYDNMLFGLEKVPGADSIYGELILEGTSDIIREKLNQEMPEEILTDTRDGFDKRVSFYKKLNGVVEPILKKAINTIRESSKKGLESEGYKKWNDAFRELNKYIETAVEEINDTGVEPGVSPPADGMQFARERIKITVEKKYSIKLLINPEIIRPGSRIIIENSSNEYVSLINGTVFEVLAKNIDKNGIIPINLSILANKVTENDCFIRAYVEGAHVEKKLFVSVVDQEIHYPKYGLEFYPDFLRTIPAHTTSLHLYFDSKKFPLGSKVQIGSNNNNFELSKAEYTLTEDDLIFENIGKINIGLRCEENDQNGKINANCNGYQVSALIEIAESGIQPVGKKGLISGWCTEDAPGQFWQKYLNLSNGKITINTSNHINRFHFGDDLTDKKVKNDKICQRYLAELISDETARYIVREKSEKGKIVADDYDGLLDELQKEKNRIAKIVYRTVGDLNFEEK